MTWLFIGFIVCLSKVFLVDDLSAEGDASASSAFNASLCLAPSGAANAHSSSKQRRSRVLVLEETPDKCLSLDVDTGHKYTLPKRSLQTPMNNEELLGRHCLPFALVSCRCADSQLAPGMLEQWTRLVKNSRFFGQAIDLQLKLSHGHEEKDANGEFIENIENIAQK